MASYPAPTENLPHFNPSVFDTEDIALTLSDANKLYAKKSGAIFYGPIAAPSLSLAGVSVGNKLNDIDANSTKLTDINFNNNTTSILNDFSVSGVLKLPDLPNAGDTIIANRNKTTKITYAIGSSMTTIGDTLKASGTLIVGSQNYNASDQFEKLSNISKSGDILTIDDSIFLTGNLRLPNFDDVNSEMLVHQKRLTDITFDEVSLITKVDRDFEVTGNFKLNTIPDVEQKIIDISNATIPYITYDSVVDKLVVTKDTDLGTNGLVCNGNLKLNTIPNVEQKIIDISNATIPYITYDSVGDKLVVTKDMNLGTNGLVCNEINLNNVFIGERAFHSGNGSGVMVKTLLNPNDASSPDAGSIFDVRSSGLAPRLWVGQYLTSPGANRFMFGYIGENGKEGDEGLYLGRLGTDGSVECTGIICNGNLQLGSIPNVEDAINNAGTPYITYDSVGDKLNVTKHMDLGPYNLTCNFMRPIDGGTYGLSSNWLSSYLEFREGGQYMDSYDFFTKQGRPLYLNYFAESDVVLGSPTANRTTTINGKAKITGNLQLGSIANVEDAINNAGGVPSITYDDVTETTSFSGNSVVMPQLTITPSEPITNVAQEIYSKHGDINGVAELKLGNDNGLSKTFANVLKSENGNATFYGKDETKYMEYNSTDDRIYIHKDTQLTSGNLYIDKIQIEETTGTPPTGQKGSLTLVHGDPGGTSSIVFRSARDPGVDHGYISYRDDYEGNLSYDRSLLEIGCKNDSGATTIDNIALMSSYVGVNTITPQTTLDVNGQIGCNEIKMNNVTIGERGFNSGDGAGVMVKTLNNPTDTNSPDNGSIFEVRSQTDDSRLWVGERLTSPGKSKFCFGYTGVNGDESLETNYLGRLDRSGVVYCTEIRVANIPINSFTNYRLGANYTLGTWGNGNVVPYDGFNPNLPAFSHTIQFDLASGFQYFTCSKLGTYEITANVIVRNTSGGRQNPCIGIAINNDTDTGTPAGPKWNLTPHDSTPFAVSYVRFNEGKVCSLTAKRIRHFTNTTDQVKIKTYLESGTGDNFQDSLTGFLILSATLQFKYIGNFDNITG